MIPKSVSVSTRIMALAAMLLLPAWGWASPNTLDDMLGSVKAGDTLLFMPGVYDKNNPPVLAPKDFQCLVRMREAMQAMDKAGAMILLPMSKLSDWQQTMKDCVEVK